MELCLLMDQHKKKYLRELKEKTIILVINKAIHLSRYAYLKKLTICLNLCLTFMNKIGHLYSKYCLILI